MKNLISIKDLSRSDINNIYQLTSDLKKAPLQQKLPGKTIALIFEKPSNRTRVSFEVGMFQLGGHAVSLSESMLGIGSRESEADVARTLSRYVNGIVYRTFEHDKVVEMAKYSSVPVINALSDLEHPCQALADVFTIRERVIGWQGDRVQGKMDLGILKGLKIVFVGDGNNVARSLALLCQKVGIEFVLSCPKGYELQDAGMPGCQDAGVKIVRDPVEAVKGADVIYTDVWTSMGQEKEKAKRLKAFKKYQLNSKLVSAAKKDALIMHCLPAHRGEEITGDVIESKNSVVFDQAENRLHVQKAILVRLLG